MRDLCEARWLVTLDPRKPRRRIEARTAVAKQHGAAERAPVAIEQHLRARQRAHAHRSDLRRAAQHATARAQERLPPRFRIELGPSRARLLDAKGDRRRRGDRAVGVHEPDTQRAAADVDRQDVLVAHGPAL